MDRSRAESERETGVTPKKRIEDPKLLSAIIDYLPLPIFVKDENSAFVLSNKRHSELVELAENQLLGHTTARLVDEEEAKASRERDIPVLESGEESVVRRDYAFSKTHSSFLETRKTRLIDVSGKRYVLGVNFDLTEIRQRETHLRALTEAVPVGIVEFTEGQAVTFANDLALRHLGLAGLNGALQEIPVLLAGSATDFPGARAKFELNLEGLVNTGKRLLVKSSGWINIPHRKERTAIVSVIDLSEMTELRRENSEINRLNQELASKVNELKDAQDEIVKKGKLEQLGQLTATIAHELRNPLGAVRTSAFLLEKKLKAQNPGTEVQFARVSNSIMRCDEIITQLLDYARTQQLDLKPVVLDSWLEKLLEEERHSLSNKIVIMCELGLGEEFVVPLDIGRMRRAIVNVLNNAVEAMVGKEGIAFKGETIGPKIKITTRLTQRGSEIAIEDNGPGMTPEILARIREPMFTTKNFGTGLGVPAIEKILEQHGGGLDVHSTVGHGSKFTLWWPIECSVRFQPTLKKA